MTYPRLSYLHPSTAMWINRILLMLAVAAIMNMMSFDLVADWRQFRGNDTSGLASDAVSDWSGEQELAWTQELPGRGLSSPIVIGNRVFVTCSSGPREERLHVLCFDAEDGNQIWERTFWATGRTVTHPKTNVAAPSPASDGERIFAFYSSNDLACLDLDGNLLWYRGLSYDFPNASNSLGMSSSPIVIDGTVIAMVESDDASFTAGLDVETGETRWQIDRPRKANWTSPAIWRGDEGVQVLLQSSAGVSAIDPRTGAEQWTYADGAATIPSLVVSNGTAYVPSHGVTAIRPGGSNKQVPDIVWQVGSLSPGTASPLVYSDKLFVTSSAGVLTCASLENGEREWQARLKGPITATPVEVGGKLIFVNEEGLLQVVDPQDKGKVVSTQELGEMVLSTPAISGGAIYIRSDGHLWKLSLK